MFLPDDVTLLAALRESIVGWLRRCWCSGRTSPTHQNKETIPCVRQPALIDVISCAALEPYSPRHSWACRMWAQASDATQPPDSFGALKQIDAGELNVGYAEAGPSDGPVTPLLIAKGYRVIVPYLRGYGTTTFLSADTFRNAQPARVALDIVAFMDALHIDKAAFLESLLAQHKLDPTRHLRDQWP